MLLNRASANFQPSAAPPGACGGWCLTTVSPKKRQRHHAHKRYPRQYEPAPGVNAIAEVPIGGEPIGVLIANSRPIVPGAVCNCRPVGVLFIKDEAGEDEKIVAVPTDKISPIYRKIQNYSGPPEMLLAKIAHFCEHYKDLEGGKWVKIERRAGEAEARATIEGAIEAARKSS